MTIFDRLARHISKMNAEYERPARESDDEQWRNGRDRWRQVKYLSYAMAAILALGLLKTLS